MKTKSFKKFAIMAAMVSPVLTGCLQMAETCDGKPYNYDIEFCQGGSVYFKCGGSEYNPSAEFCYCSSRGYIIYDYTQSCNSYNTRIYSRCGGSEYNPLAQRCESGVVETKCNSEWYNASNTNLRCQSSVVEAKCGSGWYNAMNANLRCESNVIETKCGNGWYDSTKTSLRCKNSVVEAKCGTSSWYNISTQRCESNVIETECGSGWYNASNSNLRCQESVIETKCGSGWYDASNTNLRCQSSVVETKCGSGWYDSTKTNLRCQDSVVETKCGSDWYNASNTDLRCQSNVIEAKCGTSSWYKISTQRCESNVIETECGNGWYNAANANLRCQESVIETKCGSGWYDASNTNLRCQSSVVETRCGSGWYDSTKTNLRCQDSVIESKCGSDGWYDDASMQFCSGGTIKTYKTVVIGEQTWMAENLNYNAAGSKCYSDSETNCNTYGRLYNWSTAMALVSSCNSSSCSSQISAKHRGICPSGWHIPSDAEWTTLTDFVGGSAGTKLKATSRWYNCGPSGSGSYYLCEDEFGFSALPGGYGSSSGNFYDAGSYGDWWSATESDASNAWGRNMGYSNANVGRDYYLKAYLFSVRCVQD